LKLRRTTLTKIKFIEPMYARLVNELPEGKEWLYEVKFDGLEIDTCPFATC
jgi:ATP-dependent DNA ligase